MQDLTLVIMAAGMGSRYGGLKQIEPVGPNGEFIIDYSIYDAKRAGFNKVVFIIKEENYDLFRDTVGKRVEKHMKTEYAFQKMEDIPEGYSVPKERTKPWGTVQAVLCTREYVKGDFAIINADDFYGKEAYEGIEDFFQNNINNEYLLIGYEANNTLSENGSTKRGVCEVKDGYLEKLLESVVEKQNGIITAKPINGSPEFRLEQDNLVAMNMFGFPENSFTYLEEGLKNFFYRNKDNLDKCEYLLSEFLDEYIGKKAFKIRVVPTVAKWLGVTYKEDKEELIDEINLLIKNGTYPNKLWE